MTQITLSLVHRWGDTQIALPMGRLFWMESNTTWQLTTATITCTVEPTTGRRQEDSKVAKSRICIFLKQIDLWGKQQKQFPFFSFSESVAKWSTSWGRMCQIHDSESWRRSGSVTSCKDTHAILGNNTQQQFSHWKKPTHALLAKGKKKYLCLFAGYPGEVEASVTYQFTEDNTIVINFTAQTRGKPTPINLTNHAYFNLAGHVRKKQSSLSNIVSVFSCLHETIQGPRQHLFLIQNKGTIYDHVVELFADKYLPVTDDLIPTGQFLTFSCNAWKLNFWCTETCSA